MNKLMIMYEQGACVNPDDVFEALSLELQRHSMHVVKYVEIMLRKMVQMNVYPAKKIQMQDVEWMANACKYLDIGNMLVTQDYFAKEKSLQTYEKKIIDKHSILGGRILNRKIQEEKNETERKPLELALRVAKEHHEFWNGKGYPHQLKGEEINLIARICAIADSYDAMTSYRPYRTTKSHKEACEEVIRESGTRYDPKLVDVFLHCEQEIGRVKAEEQDRAEIEKEEKRRTEELQKQKEEMEQFRRLERQNWDIRR